MKISKAEEIGSAATDMSDCIYEVDNSHKALTGFALATAAGLMTLIGALTVFYPVHKKKLRQCSCFCLASASGVMAYVSLVEVFQEGKASFKDAFDIMAKEHVENEDEIESYKLWGGMNGEALSLTCATLSFFVGWCIALVMDWALHKFMEIRDDEPLPEDNEGDQLCTAPVAPIKLCDRETQAQIRFEADTFRLVKVGWFTALALTLHNIPEGLLTYVSSLSENPGTGLGIACAIGLHNIPEGFAVAMPIYIGTKSKAKGLLYAGITGFAEPFGALIGFLIFGDGSAKAEEEANSIVMFGVLFGITAGIMTEVAIKSLLLEAARYDPEDRVVSKAWIFGAFVIAVSLIVIDVTAGGAPELCEESVAAAMIHTNISDSIVAN